MSGTVGLHKLFITLTRLSDGVTATARERNQSSKLFNCRTIGCVLIFVEPQCEWNASFNQIVPMHFIIGFAHPPFVTDLPTLRPLPDLHRPQKIMIRKFTCCSIPLRTLRTDIKQISSPSSPQKNSDQKARLIQFHRTIFGSSRISSKTRRSRARFLK
jgi:hypothetical protein